MTTTTNTNTTKKIKGLKKAAGLARALASGYHLEGIYNAKKNEVWLDEEWLSCTWHNYWHNLKDYEYPISVYPGEKQKDIEETIWSVVYGYSRCY